MSLIPCTDPCIYQQDGCCTLCRAASCSTPGNAAGCVNYVPVSKNGTEGLADIVHPNQLQTIRDN